MALQPFPLRGSPYFALFASLTLSPPTMLMSLRINLKNIPHEEVFRVCTIIGIFFDSCIAERDKQIDMRCCLSGASSSNDYDNITYGL